MLGCVYVLFPSKYVPVLPEGCGLTSMNLSLFLKNISCHTLIMIIEKGADSEVQPASNTILVLKSFASNIKKMCKLK